MMNFKYLFCFLIIAIASCGGSSSKPSKSRSKRVTAQDGAIKGNTNDATNKEAKSTFNNEEKVDSVATNNEVNETKVDNNTPVPNAPANNQNSPAVNFSLIFEQTVAGCPQECGVLFDWQNEAKFLPKLVINYTDNGQSKELILTDKTGFGIGTRHKALGVMLIKKPNDYSYFYANIAEIPKDATINKAELFLTLHKREGVAGIDTSSVIAISEYSKAWTNASDFSGGNKGEKIRDIRIKEDMKDLGIYKGTSKATGAYDFTDYVKKIQSKR